MGQAVEDYRPRHFLKLQPVEFLPAVFSARWPILLTIRALVFAGILAAAPPGFAQHGSGGGHGGGGGGGGFSGSHSGGGEGGGSYSGGGGGRSSSRIAGASRGARGGPQFGGQLESASLIGEKQDAGFRGAIRRFFGFSHVSLASVPTRPIWPRCPLYPICYGSTPPIAYGGYGGFYPGFGYGFGFPSFLDYSDYSNCVDPLLPSWNCTTMLRGPEAMLLYMNDGSAAEVTDYWTNGDTLHYISQDGHEHEILLNALNIQRTTDANARLGFRFTQDRTRPGTRLDIISPDSTGVTNLDSFAPHLNEPPDAPASMGALARAMQSTAPVNALDVSVSGVMLHAGTQTMDLVVQIGSKNLSFLSAADGKEAANLKVEAASLDQNGNILARKTETIKFAAPAKDPLLLPDGTWHIRVTIPLPSTAETVRVAVEDQNGGQIGTANVDRETIDTAPATGTPTPRVTQASASRRLETY
jgi:hypothetical protein